MPVAAACAAAVVALSGCGRSGAEPAAAVDAPASAAPHAVVPPPRRGPATARTTRQAPPYAVGERVITFVDHSRTIGVPGHGRIPRTIVTVVRYPAVGRPGAMDRANAPPDRADGPFPLVVFGHGFAATPAIYYRLLRAWAQAGYVVAAPVFPLQNAHAPGGPDEADLVNQPRDVSFVISGLLHATASPGAFLHATIIPREIAVSGQSDGGMTALAVAYDRYYLDPRVRAAVILSGAQIPGPHTLWFGPHEPPLLASQGTEDTSNLPKFTYAFYAQAHRPKYLLSLIGAQHLPPYTDQQPQLGIVERVSTAFLDRYLKGRRGTLAEMKRAGNRAGIAQLLAAP